MTTPDEIAASLTARLAALGPDSPDPGDTIPGDTAAELRTIFRAQATSRQLDLAARRMQAAGRGYYTIGSAGHESNAAVAAALRPTDPALLHYRSGGFYVRRAWQYNAAGRAGYVVPVDPIADVLEGVAADAAEPIAGGRHKVFGRHELAVIPQTSTIASHLPRAVGVAFAIDRAKKLGVASAWPTDAIAVASFGDASSNHSTTTGAINAALWCRYAGLPMPLLLVCEDNGLGISVHTPRGWVETNYGSRPGLKYFTADGTDPLAVLDAATRAADYVRSKRSPAFLHLKTVRFYGHAGSDVEAAYRSPQEIAADAERDPLIGTALILIEAGLATADELAAEFASIGADVAEHAAKALVGAALTTRAEVMAPLAPRDPAAVAASVVAAGATDVSVSPDPGSDGEPRESVGPLTVAQSINRALAGELARRPEMLLFGEDVGRKGGVYGVTRGLQHAAGRARVFDTLLDEQTILGLALGTAVTGFLPVPEIQYLAYLHNAEDQLRGEAATLQFFSRGAYRNGMVVRIAGYGYQKGFGGHVHNDTSIAVLRDIPGVVIASPSRGDDAAAMVRTCLAAAAVDGTVCAFLEPIALYHTRDLYDEGDNAWLAAYPAPAEHISVGSARTYTLRSDGTIEAATESSAVALDGPADLTILTFGNGVPISLRAARRLARAEGTAGGAATGGAGGNGAGEPVERDAIRCRVVDLRWLSPLPTGDMLREANTTGRVLIVDETRETGGVGEGVAAALIEAGFTGAIKRVASADSFVPLGPAANLVLAQEDDVIRAGRALLKS
jgi:2-oxoisovalerate dehydrogenase E1 component